MLVVVGLCWLDLGRMIYVGFCVICFGDGCGLVYSMGCDCESVVMFFGLNGLCVD